MFNNKGEICVYDLLHKNKNTFSFRDEIGDCLNMEDDIKAVDKTLFFI